MTLIKAGGIYFAKSQVVTARVGYLAKVYDSMVASPLGTVDTSFMAFEPRKRLEGEKVDYVVIIELKSSEKINHSGFDSPEAADQWIQDNLL